VETLQLDGETSLKQKNILPKLFLLIHNLIFTDKGYNIRCIEQLKLYFEFDKANDNIKNFNGTVFKCQDSEDPI